MYYPVVAKELAPFAILHHQVGMLERVEPNTNPPIPAAAAGKKIGGSKKNTN